MSATLELKYFNTFWLKRMANIADVAPGVENILYDSNVTTTITVDQVLTENQMNVGQEVTITYLNSDSGIVINYSSYVVSRGAGSVDEFVVAVAPLGTVTPITGETTVTINFGKIINFDNIPSSYEGDTTLDWMIEESRIRGGYNNTSVDLGVKAYLVEDDSVQIHKFSGLIYSGIFNSRTGINQTNQFSVAEDITRTIDPANGSVQRLYAEDTNLIIFQEEKVSKSLIDKDAIYSAEGNASVTSRNLVIGQNVAFGGEYGISKDPESFAVNGYRKYFTDREQNVVCRLSMDGITVISNYGMTDFFRDKLSTVGNGGIILGGWDAHNKQYVVSMQQSDATRDSTFSTLAFDEAVKGWVSLFSYKPDQMISLNNNFYSTKDGKIYEHYKLLSTSQARSVWYGTTYESKVTFIFNQAPSMIKNFQTINYEGDSGWTMTSFITDADTAFSIAPPVNVRTLQEMQSLMLQNTFKVKENKYYANLVNSTPSSFGEVVWGSSSSGLKGFFGEVTMSVPNAISTAGEILGKKELFAVSTGFVQSS